MLRSALPPLQAKPPSITGTRCFPCVKAICLIRGFLHAKADVSLLSGSKQACPFADDLTIPEPWALQFTLLQVLRVF